MIIYMEKNPLIREEFNDFKFVQQTLFDTVLLAIPDFLEEIPEEEKRAKLPPSAQDHMFVFSNKRRDMLFQMTMENNSNSVMDAKTLLQQIGIQVSSSAAGFQLFGSGTKDVNKTTVACMNYKYNTPNGNKYVILFIFLVDEKYFMGNFIVPFECQAECTNIFLLMIDTLKLSFEN